MKRANSEIERLKKTSSLAHEAFRWRSRKLEIELATSKSNLSIKVFQAVFFYMFHSEHEIWLSVCLFKDQENSRLKQLVDEMFARLDNQLKWVSLSSFHLCFICFSQGCCFKQTTNYKQ